MKKPLNVFIGFDRNEPVAYHVLAHSIMKRASRPVSITPLYLPQLQSDGTYTRRRGTTESTEFSMTRFLTPYLTGFEGVSIFMDSDMLCMADICELEDIALSDPYKDVFVVKHDYTPSTTIKFLGQQQTSYPCKNWSSLMVFNSHRSPVRLLSPEYINRAPPSELHQFKWANEIGALDPAWNHLVGEYMPAGGIQMAHFTLGGPWFSEYQNCEYSKQWHDEFMEAYLPHYPLIAGAQGSIMQASNHTVSSEK